MCSVTDSCTDHSHGRIEPTSSAPLTHTFGLHEMPVTRSLLSIGQPFLRPLIWLAACGAGPLCSMKQWKRTFPCFWFCCCFCSPSIFTLCLWLEKSTHTLFSLFFCICPLSYPRICDLHITLTHVNNILEHAIIFSYIHLNGKTPPEMGNFLILRRW